MTIKSPPRITLYCMLEPLTKKEQLELEETLLETIPVAFRRSQETLLQEVASLNLIIQLKKRLKSRNRLLGEFKRSHPDFPEWLFGPIKP